MSWVTADAPPLPSAVSLVCREAVHFVGDLHRFARARHGLLIAARPRDRARAAAGRFLAETEGVRASAWTVKPAPSDLRDRRVEITGPPTRAFAARALGSGAQTWMADLEDSTAPQWEVLIEGQAVINDAVWGRLAGSPEPGRTPPVIIVRPRGWHLVEPAVRVDHEPALASVVDAGLFLFHNAHKLIKRGSGPYIYLPKLEGHLEARLWNDLLSHAEELLGLPSGAVRVTALIETVTAALEMDEILFELRDRVTALSPCRWDYIFSWLTTCGSTRSDLMLLDRRDIRPDLPLIRSVSDRLVETCHRRGALAIGDIAPHIPAGRDPEQRAAAMAAVRAEKEHEAAAGFDGSWVPHPALVPLCAAAFTRPVPEAPARRRSVGTPFASAGDASGGAVVTAVQLRDTIGALVTYLEAWLRGIGAVVIDGRIEDAATAEIARSQLWLWASTGVGLDDGRVVSARLIVEELDRIGAEFRPDAAGAGTWQAAGAVIASLVSAPTLTERLASASERWIPEETTWAT